MNMLITHQGELVLIIFCDNYNNINQSSFITFCIDNIRLMQWWAFNLKHLQEVQNNPTNSKQQHCYLEFLIVYVITIDNNVSPCHRNPSISPLTANADCSRTFTEPSVSVLMYQSVQGYGFTTETSQQQKRPASRIVLFPGNRECNCS